MVREPSNYAFIDAQNLHLGIKSLGWSLDWKKFRVYLRDKYGVRVAYLFLGFIPEHARMYQTLQKAGFILKFKPVVMDVRGRIKGNVDADVVLWAMIEYEKYAKAVLVTSDGDFYSLASYLNSREKLEVVLSPYLKRCSRLLIQSAQGKIAFMDTLQPKLEFKK